MTDFKTIGEFASDKLIIKLLAKERGKYAYKNRLNPTAVKTDALYEQIKAVTPPRSEWTKAGSDKRRKKSGFQGEKTKICSDAAARVNVTILRALRLQGSPSADGVTAGIWLQNLDAFILEIHSVMEGRTELVISPPRIIPKEKERNGNTFIYRPICVYDNLRDKILLAIAYKYLITYFDDCFGSYMLFMRGSRYTDGKWRTPDCNDAIKMAEDYRARHDKSHIYVGECDIQKFYNIINHDVIMDCCDDLFNAKRSALAVSRIETADDCFGQALRIVKAYLDSFDYLKCIYKLNGDEKFWAAEKERKVKQGVANPECRFGWVSDDIFTDSVVGCYTPEGIMRAKEGGKIGIPQGGPLSGIIVNIVMRRVDREVVDGDDPDRLFVRYCDDILLMHTDPKRCAELLNTYYNSLKANLLIPHFPHEVREFKAGDRTRSGFWHCKSKNTFLWGRGDGNASDWITFVGIDMRREGQVRIRKSTADNQKSKIDRAFTAVVRDKYLRQEGMTEQFEKQFEKLPDGFVSRYKRLHALLRDKMVADRFTENQALHIDKYFRLKIRKAASRLRLADPASLAHHARGYLDTLTKKR